MTTDETLPQNMPATGLLTACSLPTLKPHSAGQNWLYVKMQSITAWTAKATSLNRTVVSGERGCRAAYCWRIKGEKKKLVV